MSESVTLRSDQQDAVDAGLTAIAAGRNLLIVSPTGSGKTIVANALRDRAWAQFGPGVVLVPGLDIGIGFGLKRGMPLDGLSEAKVRAALAAVGIYTTQQYHNLLLAGKVDPPRWIIGDESHHSVSATWVVIRALAGDVPLIGLTATGFRGTPEETQKLRELYGPPYIALTLKDAVDRGIISRPDFTVWPLLNDDEITVTNGEFQTKAVENALTTSVIEDLVSRLRAFGQDDIGRWDRPTLIRCPGVLSAGMVNSALTDAGLGSWCITGESSSNERQEAFAACLARRAALVQVKVVGEGVDLAARRLIDLAPTMSPVAWMQAVGRITRPGADRPPEYIATNHNLTRHAYLWAGLIPPGQIKAAQQAWGEQYKPKRRSLARALGLEGFGKFLVTPVPMCDGSLGSLYSLQTCDGLHQYGVFLHPCQADPLYFERSNSLTGKRLTKELPDGRVIEYDEKTFGRWRRIASVPNAEGYLSVKPGHMSPKQAARWLELAEGRGLDATAVPDARQFEILFMFLQGGAKYKPEAT